MSATAPALLALAASLVPVSTVLALHFRDGPPARVTGGFDEDSCIACHAGTVNDAEGRLTLEGFPERYTPGKTYALELALSRPQMAVAGFQLAVRHAADRTQAGRIEVPNGNGAPVGRLDERGVQFAHHLLPAAAAGNGGKMRWKLSWTAPDSQASVLVHAAAVAGDGDDSELGDHVYTLERAASPD